MSIGSSDLRGYGSDSEMFRREQFGLRHRLQRAAVGHREFPVRLHGLGNGGLGHPGTFSQQELRALEEFLRSIDGTTPTF